MNTPLLSFWGHIEDMRKTCIKIGLIIFASMFLSLFFYKHAINFLLSPLEKKQNEHSIEHQILQIEKITNTSSLRLSYRIAEDARLIEPEESFLKKLDENTVEIEPGGSLIIEAPVRNRLVILSPIEGIVSTFKISLWLGLLGSSPFWLFQLIKFILPALSKRERKALIPFLLISYLCIGMGMAFAYLVSIPIADYYLYKFNEPIGQNLWSIKGYLDFSVMLLLSHGLLAELIAILFALVHFRIITAEMLSKARRYVYVLIFVLSALLTPPDVLTQLLVAFPLVGIYELSILYARTRQERRPAIQPT